jgi:hypothetical protein
MSAEQEAIRHQYNWAINKAQQSHAQAAASSSLSDTSTETLATAQSQQICNPEEEIRM